MAKLTEITSMTQLYKDPVLADQYAMSKVTGESIKTRNTFKKEATGYTNQAIEDQENNYKLIEKVSTYAISVFAIVTACAIAIL